VGTAQEDAGPRKKSDGTRVSALEEETLRTDQRLRRLEANSQQLRGDVDELASATGDLRRSSAKMRVAAERVAQAVLAAAQRRRKGAPPVTRKSQAERRPPRTK
jgi:hypothetical protein